MITTRIPTSRKSSRTSRGAGFPVLGLLAGVILCAVLLSLPAFSWLPQFVTETGSGGTPQPAHWDFTAFPVTWQLNPTTGSNITGSRSVADVMQASFNAWTGAPNAAIAISRGPDSSATSAGVSYPSLPQYAWRNF